MGIKNHTPGQIRYFTYYIEFPESLRATMGADHWVDSVPFVHELQFELKKTTFGKIPGMARDILAKGECHWKDQNGVGHRVKVTNEPETKIWGVKKPSLQSLS
jgi:hypothetical protein